MLNSDGPFQLFPPNSYVPLSQLPLPALRARADQLRRMAATATSFQTEGSLLKLAERFEALADQTIGG